MSCGSGTRDRDVDCIFNEQIVDASLCSEGQKPLRTERCTLLACAHWDVEQWGPCSITCGSGIQTRAVKCVRGSTKSAANDRECPVSREQCQENNYHNSFRDTNLEPNAVANASAIPGKAITVRQKAARVPHTGPWDHGANVRLAAATAHNVV